MSIRTWILVIGATVVTALVLIFLGTSVPGCFAPAGGTISPECIARWEAGWSLPERIVRAYGLPRTTLGVFLFFVAVAAVTHFLQRRRRRPR
jgi:hypothetical protein